MPALRRALSARAMPGSAASRARERARVVASSTCLRARPAASVPRLRAPVVAPPTSLRPRPSSCSRSPSTSLVCWRPRVRMPCTSSWASSAVTRPRETASSKTSSIRSRVTITMLSGAISREVSASRSSATFLPEKSSPRDSAAAAGLVAADAVLLACLRAVCWRPRALPPAFAARLRAGALALLLLARLRDDDPPADLFAAEPPLPEDFRADDPALRDELLRDEELRAEVLRDDDPERDVDLREEDEPPLLDDLRDDDPPLRPPLDFRFESAMSRSSSAPRYEAGLCHLEARFDGRAIGQAYSGSAGPYHLAFGRGQAARW